MLLTLILKPLTDKALIPYTAVIVLLGFISSELLVSHGIDTGIRYDNFNNLISAFFIPTVLFNTALSFDNKIIHKDLATLIYLTTGAFALTILITTVLIYYGINHPTGFPWEAALLTASIVSATNARVISDLLRHAGISLRLLLLLESESLITSVLSVSLFGFLIMELKNPDVASPGTWILHLIITIVVPIVVGFLLGKLAILFLKRDFTSSVHTALLLILVYGLYGITQWVLPTSGALAVFIFGMSIKNFVNNKPHLTDYWRTNTFIATMIMFFLLGVTITGDMFSERWLAMLIGIVSLLYARLLSIIPGLYLLSEAHLVKPLKLQEQGLLALAGTRGALTIALAFMLPETLDYWWTIQAIAFGVVVFSILIQAPIAAWWTRLLTGRKP